MVVLGLLLLTSLIYLIRHALVLAGLLKGPILRLFEKYGDEEPFYYPLPGMLVALSVFVLALGILVAPYVRAFYLPAGPALILLILAWIAWDRREVARRHPEIFMVYPRWINHLREYTTREERRRIAYMWLHLPWRTRLHYNSNDRAFLLWTDLLVLSTGERNN
ncbi:MAG: hypothetical protein DIU68_016495 [Chloroflexota bacterium]